MAAMDMEKVTKYLERLMYDFSLSNQRSSLEDGLGMSEESKEDQLVISDRTLELNSNISVPSHLQQCLDLKTGEVYYINRNTRMRVKEDNKNNADDDFSGGSDVTVVSEEDTSYCESEESSSESWRDDHNEENHEVLVVAGCKACYIYFMVPKLLRDCPKCASQLLHFDP